MAHAAWRAFPFLLAFQSRAWADEPKPELQIATGENGEAPAMAGGDDGSPPPGYVPPRHRGHFPEGLFLPVGMSFAGAAHPRSDSSFALGAETSLVLFPVGEGYWAGGYGDVVYETTNELTRTSLGLEFGFTFIGIDGGVVAQFGNGETHWGGVIRPMLSASLLTFYGRWGFFAHADDFREVGVLLKLPIHLVDSEDL